jgi:uncharacterized Fe-S radical SAM superfamily protein PflX
VGLPVSAALYWILCQNMDLSEEHRLATAEASELEALAEEQTRHATGAD